LIRYPIRCGHITQYKDVSYGRANSPPPKGDGNSARKLKRAVSRSVAAKIGLIPRPQ
jgi:hypothetical protein